MQPFRITCVTCRSRLKIRTPDVIGEIHACPKCGSMVQIVPPAGWDLSSGNGATDNSSASSDAALSITTTGSILFPPNALDDLSGVEAALNAPAVDIPVATTAAVPVEDVPSVELPPAAANSPLMWWAIGGMASLLVVAGLAWVVWPSSAEKVAQQTPAAVVHEEPKAPAEPQEVQKPVDPVVEKSESKPAPTENADSAKVATDEAAKPAPVEPASNNAKSTEPKLVEQAPVAQAPVEAKPESPKVVDPPKPAVAEATRAKDPAPAPATVAALHAPDHSPVLKFDPLDFDLDRLGSSTKTPADSTASTSSIPSKLPAEAASNTATTTEAPPENAVAEQSKQPTENEAAALRAFNNGVMVRRGLPAEAPQHSAAQILASRVRSMQVADMPLARFVETMSGIAGSPITLDPIALEQVGITLQATVSVNMQDVPLQAVLHEGLGQRRLDVADQAGQLRVVLPKADAPHAIDYEVKDLVAGGDAAAIGKLIEHFVAPETWKSAGGKGTIGVEGTTLHIEQSDAVRRQVVIFCERLRLARGLALASKYPSSLLSIESPYHSLAAKLDEHTTFTFLPWTRLSEVVGNWQQMSGITVLVDWGALTEAELVPVSPVACSANDRSWQDSLDGVLEPLGLGWWAVNGDTIQITTLASLDKIQRVEFYQVPSKMRDSFATGAAIESLRKDLADAAGKSKPATPQMALDEPSGRLIVLATPGGHRHLGQRLGSGAKK